MPILTLNDPAFKDIGKYKVVTPERVEELTRAGWKLVAVVVPEPAAGEPTIQAAMHPMFGPVAYYDRERGGRQNEYILGKDETSVVAEANAKIADIEKQLGASELRAVEASNTIERLRNRISRCKTVEEAKAVVAELRKAPK